MVGHQSCQWAEGRGLGTWVSNSGDKPGASRHQVVVLESPWSAVVNADGNPTTRNAEKIISKLRKISRCGDITDI